MLQRPSDPAKFSPPLAAGTLVLARLEALLERACERPVVAVSGPAGCGKTTLVAGWLRRGGRPVLWYRVDPGDADPASLFHDLRLAVRSTGRIDAAGLPPAYDAVFERLLDAFAGRFFRMLFSGLGPVDVVLDNVQDVPADAPLHDIVARAADALPAESRLILISRSPPHPVLARFRAQRQLAEVAWPDLRLTPDEVADLLAHLYGDRLAAEQQNAIVRAADGWMAGVILIAEGATAGAMTAPADLPDAVFDYLAVEVFRRLDRDCRRVLLTAALMPGISAAAARAVSADPGAAAVLEEMCRRNLFTERRQPGPVFSFHPLFRRFLLRRAAQDLDPHDLQAARRRAVDRLTSEGHIDDAVTLIRDMRDWDALTTLIETHAPAFVATGRHRTIASWLAGVAEPAVQSRPELLYWRGVSSSIAEPETARSALIACYERAVAEGDAAGAYRAWAALVQLLTEFTRYQPDLDVWIDALEPLQARFPRCPSPRLEGQVALAMLAALGYRRPWHPDIAAWGERAMTLARQPGDVAAEFAVCFHRLHTLVFMPLTHIRLLLLDRQRQLLGRPEISVVDRIRHHFACAVHHCFTGDHPACVGAADRAIAEARENGLEWFEPVVLYQLGRSHQNAGDLAAADRIATRIRDCAERIGDPALTYLYVLTGVQAYLRGRLVEAEQRANAALAMLGSSAATLGHVVTRFLLAHVLTEQGKTKSARQQLNQLQAFAESSGNAQLRHHCLLADAEIAVAANDAAQARAHLAAALAIAEDLDVSHAYVWRPDALARLLARALEHDIEPATACRIIRERCLPSPPEARALEAWPWRLRVRTLGDFAILRDGARLSFDGKAQSRPLDLLKAVIAFGCERIDIEHLKDALWPDADGDAAQRAFDTTLYRLRRLLGVEGALLLSEGRLTLSADVCWVDVCALEDLAKRIRGIANQGAASVDSIAHLTVRAARLGIGAFLEGFAPDAWTASRRRKLAAVTARVFLDLGRVQERHGRIDDAITAFRRAAAVDGAPATAMAEADAALHRLAGRRHGARL